MGSTPRVSVIIPTRARPAKLGACLARLAGQRSPAGGLAPRFEVIVVLDGACPASRAVAERADAGLDLTVIEAERLGIAHTKNVGIAHARGEIVLLVNDDVLPDERFVASHAAAHRELDGEVAMIVGHSPWVVAEPETLFSLALRTTSMVFFYDRMIDDSGRVHAPRDHDWGYRHAWNLNLSLPRHVCEEVGGFRPAIANCCYEDVEFAWRVARAFGAPCLFRPEALAPHDHSMTPGDYLAREWRLGYSAHGFAHAAPQCARELFGRDLRHEEKAASIAPEAAGPAREAFVGEALSPASGLAPAERAQAARDLYRRHLPVKRAVFAQGLDAARSGQRIQGLFHIGDALPTDPGLAAGALSLKSG